MVARLVKLEGLSLALSQVGILHASLSVLLAAVFSVHDGLAGSNMGGGSGVPIRRLTFKDLSWRLISL